MSAMKICCRLGFSVLAMACAFAQTSPVPYADGPSYSATKEEHSYPGSYRSIRIVDFRNLNNGMVPLRNGHYEHNEPNDHSSVDLDSVRYLTPPSRTGEGFALVIYSWFAVGGTAQAAAITRLCSTFPEAVCKLCSRSIWETHNAGPRPTWSFDPKTNILVVRSDHYRPGDAHCCISAVDVVTFRWTGTPFVHTGITTELLPPVSH